MTATVVNVRTNMRFALAFAGISFRNSLAYRADAFVKLAGYPVRLIMAFFLWQTLFGAGVISGVRFEDVITYYLIAYFLTQMYPFVRMGREIRAEIYSGDVAVFLARGVPHWAVWLGRFLAAAGAYITLIAPVAAIMIWLFGRVALSPQAVFGFLLLITVGLVIKGQLWYLIGISSYYTEENIGTIRFYELAERLLSGAVLPLFLFPDWAVRVQKFLPFSYTLYLPVTALIRPMSWAELLESFGVAIAWALVLGVLVKVVSEDGWRRFTGHGI